MSDIVVVPLLPSADYAELLKTSTEQWRELFGG